MTRNRWCWLVAACAAVTVLLCAPLLRAPFFSDDFSFLYNASHFRAPLDLLRPHGLPTWRPTQQLFFWLLYPWAGLDSVPYHLVHFTLYLATALLLAVLVMRLQPHFRCGLVAALAFLVYRSHWEPLSFIAAGDEIITAFLTVACVLCYDVWLRNGRPAARVACLLLGAATLMSKESAFVLPLLLWLLSRIRGRGGWDGWVWLLSVAAVGGRWWLSHQIPGLWVPHPHLPWALFDQTERALLGSTYINGAFFGVCYVTAVAWSWKRQPPLAFFLLWTSLGMLVETVLLADVNQARHYFLASVGSAGAVACLLAMQSRSTRMVCWAVATVYVGWNALGLEGKLMEYASLLGTEQRERRLQGMMGTTSTVYVYNHPDQWANAARAVALYGGVDAARIHDWYDMDRLGDSDVALFYEVGYRRFSDFTGLARELVGKKSTLPVCDRSAWMPRGLEEVPSGGLRTDGSGLLVSPDMRLNPFDLWYVEVEYRVISSAAGAQQHLAWTSDLQASYDPGRFAFEYLNTDGRVHTARYVIGSLAQAWSGGFLRRFFLLPATVPATVEIGRIQVVCGPPHRRLWDD